MATHITAPTQATRPAPRFGALAAAVVAVSAAAAIGVVAWSQISSARDVTIDSQALTAGYPLHGGLAGPSRVGLVSNAAAADHYGAGYPFNGGLAGPSRIGLVSAVDVADHYGAGYPLTSGLAGPSRTLPAIDLADHYGAGYPLRGGLAGPSRADGEE